MSVVNRYLISRVEKYFMKSEKAECLIEHVGRYTLSHYKKSDDTIVVVFASAGARLAGPIEEFKGSLRKYKVSMLFVLDSEASFFAKPETIAMFEKVAEIAGPYDKIAVMGESMGGSGALIFPRFCHKIDRTLAFSPLYSFGYPFSNFASGPRDGHSPIFWAFDSDDKAAKARSVLIYGARQWQDAAHAGQYLLHGYDVLTLAGAGHLVASYLKKGYDLNYLAKLLDLFLDFSIQFDAGLVRDALAPVLAEYGSDEREWSFESAMKRAHLRVAHVTLPGPPEGAIDLAKGRPTEQSSVCEYSAGKTTAEDSARALLDPPPEFYAFHTDLENRPWWKVSLDNAAEVEEIRIYNRIDTHAERGLRFTIDVREHGRWKSVFRKNDDSIFGGIDGTPFIWRPEQPIGTREIRVRSLLHEDYLHYQKIEVFGRIGSCLPGSEILPSPECIDLALERPTSQSSICKYSIGKTPEEDSANAVSSRIYRPYAFHTDLEKRPWWQVDLGAHALVEEIHVYNRSGDEASRGLCFVFESHENGRWVVIHRKSDGKPFGDLNGEPYVWRPKKRREITKLRIRLSSEDYLHFQKIEVLGMRMPVMVSDEG